MSSGLIAFTAPFAASTALEFAPEAAPEPAPEPRQLTLSAAIALGRMRGSQATSSGCGSGWQRSQSAAAQPLNRWQSAQSASAQPVSGFAATVRQETGLDALFARAQAAGSGLGARYQRMTVADQSALARWQVMSARGGMIRVDWHRYQPRDLAALARWQAMQAQQRAWLSACQQGKFQPREWRIPWQGGQPLTGVSWPIPPLPEPPLPPLPPVDIHFICPFLFTGDMEFVRDCGGMIRIPLRRVYCVLHEIAITRVSDGATVEFADLTLSSDIGSWGWSLSGNALGATTYARLTAEPYTEINVAINGLNWRFLITSVNTARTFGKTGYAVTGLSPALALTAPLSDARSAALAADWTVQQLADQQVADTAWTVDWQASNWLVPGGVWQYSSQTPLQVISDIASAAGAFVQAERVNRILRVRPRYPAWPWEWGTAADAEWPTAILTNLQQTPKFGNNYNAVYAAGTRNGGLMGYVKRAGTAGDQQPGAPITHALITHADAARAFGGTYLADQQDQIAVSFDTILGGDAPLAELATRLKLTEPGLASQTLLTEAVSIRVQRGNNAVTVTQSVSGVAFV